MPIQDLVVGSDGHRPIVDTEPLWRIWNISEVWRGEAGLNKYVPKLDDWVVDPRTREHWIVDHLDEVTLVPTLTPFNLVNDGLLAEVDKLIGTGPGHPSEVYRLYVNKTITPHTGKLDAGCHIKSNIATYAKFFKGVDTSNTGIVISKIYDNAGNIVSQSVPLELVAIDSHVNYGVKVPQSFKLTEDLQDNDLITVVAYADDGHVVYRRQVQVMVTDTIQTVNAPVKYVTGISVRSIWLAPGDDSTILYPLNLPINDLNMKGVVHYSDGSETEYPVNGQQFRLEGFGTNNLLTTIEGQRIPLVARYTLADNEIGESSNGTNGRYETRPMWLLVDNPNYSVSVKLFGYPEWISDAEGYYMRWFLTNAERNVFFEVTSHVQLDPSTGVFHPKGYMTLQRKIVRINLADVSPTFIPYIHNQTVDIVLRQPPSPDAQAPWTVLSPSSDSTVHYGLGTYAKIVTAGQVNLSEGFTSQSDWLEAYYYRTIPLSDPSLEVRAPLPTHFIIDRDGTETEFDVSNWNYNLNLGVGLAAGDTLFIRWIRRLVSNDLQLAVSAIQVKQI